MASTVAATDWDLNVANEWTVWTIRFALIGYATSLLVRMWIPPGGGERFAAARLFWTLGCLTYLAHVAAAFHFEHGWSHARAWEHTAARTGEMTPWHWGGGIYVNYLFTLLWAADVAWWWADRRSHEARPAWITAALHAFMLFVAFNATVVFGEGVIRWCGLAGMLLLAAAWWRWRAARQLGEDRRAEAPPDGS